MSRKIKAGALALICCVTVLSSMFVMIMAALTTNVNNDFSIIYTPAEGYELGMTGSEFGELLFQHVDVNDRYLSAVSFDYYNESGIYTLPGGGV